MKLTTTDSLTFETLAHYRTTKTVINRINFPKREAGKMTRGACLNSKMRAPLSDEDEREVAQTVALVLIRCGAYDAPLVTRHDANGKAYTLPDFPRSVWSKVFIGVREVILRERNTRAAQEESGILLSPDGDESALSESAAMECHTLADPEKLAAFRQRVADKAALAMHIVRAAHAADPTRKRKSRKSRAVSSLRYILSAVTGNGLCQRDTFANEGARRRAMFDLRCYLSEGCTALGIAHAAPDLEFSNLEALPDLAGIVDARKAARARANR